MSICSLFSKKWLDKFPLCATRENVEENHEENSGLVQKIVRNFQKSLAKIYYESFVDFDKKYD